MKKKFRELTIGEKTYGWTIKKNTDDNDGSKIINIWFDKQIIHSQKLNEEKVTPSVVKTIISRKNL